MESSLPASFTLAEGSKFTLAALLRWPTVQPVAALNLEVDLSV